MIYPKNFKELNRIMRRRKYFLRHEWWIDRNHKRHYGKRYGGRGKLLYIWIDYIITTPQEAKEALHHKKYCCQNLTHILNEYIQDYGKPCELCGGKQGILYGVEITNEDYYWVLKTDNGFVYESCVGKYKLV